MTIQIESDQPIPTSNYSRRGVLKELREVLRSMAVGQSFLWEKSSRLVYLAAKQEGVRVTVRKTTDGKLRAWRI